MDRARTSWMTQRRPIPPPLADGRSLTELRCRRAIFHETKAVDQEDHGDDEEQDGALAAALAIDEDAGDDHRRSDRDLDDCAGGHDGLPAIATTWSRRFA